MDPDRYLCYFSKVDKLSRTLLKFMKLCWKVSCLVIKLSFKSMFPHGVKCFSKIFYGLFRIISDYFRDLKHLGYIFLNLSMGSMLSIMMIIFGFLIFYKILVYDKNK